MANIQYYTTVKWDSNIKDIGTDKNGLAINATATTAGAPSNTAKKWIAGAFVQNEVDGKLYKNSGSSLSPNFVEVGAGGGGLPITTILSGGIVATYDQTNDFLGLGLTGAGQVFDTGSGGYNMLASLDTTPFGGSPDTTIVGYLTAGPGAQATSQFGYDAGADESSVQIQTQNLAGKQAQIRLKSNPSNSSITFNFNGGNYKFPSTSPGVGQVLGYASANTLDWVTVGGGGISIGDAIGGGVIADAVLFADASGNLKDDARFTFDSVLGVFEVGTNFGTAIYTSNTGGMGNLIELGDVPGTLNKTKFGVYDGSKIIRGITDFVFQIQDSSSPTAYLGFEVNNSSLYHSVSLGDTQNIYNGTKFIVTDIAKTITATTDSNFIVEKVNGDNWFDVSTTADRISAGDLAGTANGTKYILDDGTQSHSFTGSEYQNSTVTVDSSITTTYTVQNYERIIYVNTNTAGVTVTLPSVSAQDKRMIRIKCIGTNGVTIVASVGSVDTGSLTTGQVGEWQALNSTITWQRIM